MIGTSEIRLLAHANLASDCRITSGYNGYMNGEAFQDGIVSFRNWQYAVYLDEAGHVNVARRSIVDISRGEAANNPWSILTFTDYATESRDPHNTISIGVCPADGTIHLAFDMHASKLNYRRSVPGLATDPSPQAWSPASFGPVVHNVTETDNTRLTYPQFRAAPDGRLQMTIRTGGSGNGNQALYEYIDGTWTNLGEFIDGQGERNAYLFGINYSQPAGQGQPVLAVTWNWRETSVTASSNHDVMFAYSTDFGRTWKNSDGVHIGTTGAELITQSTTGVRVWTIPENRGLHNTESQVVDSHGQVHVLASHLPADAPDEPDWHAARNNAVLVHYYRDTAGTWHQIYSTVREGASRSQIGVDANDGIYTITPNAVVTDPDYLTLRIATASAKTQWTDWSVDATLTDRPVRCDPLVDQRLLAESDLLSIYYVEKGGSRLGWADWLVNG